MKYSKLIKQFNLDVIAGEYKVRFTGDVDARRAEREELKAQYTGTIESGYSVVGIKPTSRVQNGKLMLSWEVSAVRDVNGTLMSIDFPKMTADEVAACLKIKQLTESIVSDDLDVDETLEQQGFVRYTREEVA